VYSECCELLTSKTVVNEACKLENEPPSIKNPGQTDRVIVLANPYTCKNQGQMSVGSKARVNTDVQTDERTISIAFTTFLQTHRQVDGRMDA